MVEHRPARFRRPLAIVVAVELVLFGVLTGRLFVWPDLDPLPARADAVIELGGLGDRDSAALLLARDHRAGVLIQSTVVAEAGTDRCLPPVPDVEVLCFHADPGTTRGEAEYIGTLAAQRGWTSVILVTTPDQAVRAKLRVSRCFGGRIQVSTTPLPTPRWFTAIPYQWAATVKALVFETSC